MTQTSSPDAVANIVKQISNGHRMRTVQSYTRFDHHNNNSSSALRKDALNILITSSAETCSNSANSFPNGRLPAALSSKVICAHAE